MNNNNKVLLFDDEQFTSNIFVSNLKSRGWDVTHVSNIDDLFMELSTRKFDVLILDIMASTQSTKKNVRFTLSEKKEMDSGSNTGVVLAKKIWNIENGKYKDLPILFLSVRPPIGSLSQFSRDGRICDYIRKPELVRIVNEKLDSLINRIIN